MAQRCDIIVLRNLDSNMSGNTIIKMIEKYFDNFSSNNMFSVSECYQKTVGETDNIMIIRPVSASINDIGMVMSSLICYNIDFDVMFDNDRIKSYPTDYDVRNLAEQMSMY